LACACRGGTPSRSRPASAGSPSVELPPARVLDRVVEHRLLGFPRLALAEMRRPERAVSARVGGAAEADLVPRPGMRVERLRDVAHHDLPGARDVDRVPDAPVEL